MSAMVTPERLMRAAERMHARTGATDPESESIGPECSGLDIAPDDLADFAIVYSHLAGGDDEYRAGLATGILIALQVAADREQA